MTTTIEQTRRYEGSTAEGQRTEYQERGYPTASRRFTDQPLAALEDNAQRRARGLGWFSIGLGLAQIGAPRSLARLIGIRDDEETRNTMFAIGLREITSGLMDKCSRHAARHPISGPIARPPAGAQSDPRTPTRPGGESAHLPAATGTEPALRPPGNPH